ncbi:hypothetical protein ES703_22664 [subsurface metagenome]
MAKLKYTEDFPLMAEDLARQGLTNIQIARKLGISKDTFYEYQKIYPEFSDSIKKGKRPVDIEVENALLKRAMGYGYEEVHAEYNMDKEGKQKAFPSKIRKIKKQIVADVTAQIFWLKNRRPKLWKDKHDVDVSGNVNIKVVSAIPRPKKGKKNA